MRKISTSISNRDARSSRSTVALILPAIVLFVGLPVEAMTINFSFNDFDCTTLGAPACSAVAAAAKTALPLIGQIYANTFLDPITVNIDVEFGGPAAGGASSYAVSSLTTYANYRTKLIADQKSAADASAVASLPMNAPIGDGNVFLTPANARAVGINNAANIAGIKNGPYDGVIFFGAMDPWFYRTGGNIGAMQEDFYATAEHEIDEVLGTESYLDCVKNAILCAAMGNPVRPPDLFRYSGMNIRSYTTDATKTAFFSFDGGATLPVQYNQSGNGDYGDWLHNCAAYKVQDQTVCAGQLANLGPEIALLDVIGYDIPEPAAPLLVGTGLTLFFALKRMRLRRSSR